jgi:hypothetical protein
LGLALTHPLVLHSGKSDEIEAVPFEPEIPLTLMMLYSRHRPVSRTVMRFVAKIREVFVEVHEEMQASASLAKFFSRARGCLPLERHPITHALCRHDNYVFFPLVEQRKITG